MFPNADKVRRAFGQLDVLATVEVRRTETTAMSTHVLPGTSQLERPDLPSFIDTAFPVSFSQYGAQVVEPSAERKPTWWIMHEIGRRMGLRLPKITDETTDDSILASRAARARVPFAELRAASSGVVGDDAPGPGWLIPERLPHRLDLAPAELVEQFAAWSAGRVEVGQLLLVNRRLPHQMNSDLQDIESQQRKPFPTLLINPDDVARLGLDEGVEVIVRSRFGHATAQVETSEIVRPGVVSLPHGWSFPEINQLTSDLEELDPITGMPLFSGIPVAVE
jgi:anaerobic selenocysteine-containing dehydrogenase